MLLINWQNTFHFFSKNEKKETKDQSRDMVVEEENKVQIGGRQSVCIIGGKKDYHWWKIKMDCNQPISRG
jgi:hypothetical protein